MWKRGILFLFFYPEYHFSNATFFSIILAEYSSSICFCLSQWHPCIAAILRLLSFISFSFLLWRVKIRLSYNTAHPCPTSHLHMHSFPPSFPFFISDYTIHNFWLTQHAQAVQNNYTSFLVQFFIFPAIKNYLYYWLSFLYSYN